MTGWNKAQDEIYIFQIQRLRGACEFALLSSSTDSCHRARYNLLHCRNISVRILSHDKIIESSAGSCISIPVNVLLLCIRRQCWQLFIYFLPPEGHFTYMTSHTRLAAAMSSAEPQPPSLLVSKVYMYIRDFWHDPHFATF